MSKAVDRGSCAPSAAPPDHPMRCRQSAASTGLATHQIGLRKADPSVPDGSLPDVVEAANLAIPPPARRSGAAGPARESVAPDAVDAAEARRDW